MRQFISIVVAFVIGGISTYQDGSKYFSQNEIEGVIFKEPLPLNYQVRAKRQTV